jgi:hypothetical protein
MKPPGSVMKSGGVATAMKPASMKSSTSSAIGKQRSAGGGGERLPAWLLTTMRRFYSSVDLDNGKLQISVTAA